MPVAWRITKEQHADTAFSGEGARQVGGRWNPEGVPVVYASESQALAALEVIANLGPGKVLRQEYVRIRVDIPEDLVHTIEAPGRAVTFVFQLLIWGFSDEIYGRLVVEHKRSGLSTSDPSDWKHAHWQWITRLIGADWASHEYSAALRVPSAAADEEFNYLINPEHPEFEELETGESRPFRFHPNFVVSSEVPPLK